MSEIGSNQDVLSMNELGRGLWRAKWRIALVTFVLLGGTYFILQTMPKLYESSASILVEPRENFFQTTPTTTRQGLVSDDVVMSSQVQLIESADTLRVVIERLDLQSVPEFAEAKPSLTSLIAGPINQLLGREESTGGVEQRVLSRLANAISVQRERQSRVISISVQSEDRNLAAQIANAIAETHIGRRAQQSIDDTQEATKWLDVEISKLRESVSEAEVRVARFRVEHDLFTGSNNTTLADQSLSDVSRQITQAQERKNSARSRANLIRQLLSSGQSISGVSDVQGSVVVQRLSESKATLQRQRAELLATLLPNHPEIQSVTAQIDEIEKQIQTEARQVADALEAEAQIEASLEATLRDDLARLKLEASEASGFSVQLAELEREASAQRQLLETYLLRYSEAQARTSSSASLPDLRVITVATPSLKPSSPKTNMTLIVVAFASLLFQIGGIVFMHFVRGIGQQLVAESDPSRMQEATQVSNAASRVDMAAAGPAVPPRSDLQSSRKNKKQTAQSKASDIAQTIRNRSGHAVKASPTSSSAFVAGPPLIDVVSAKSDAAIVLVLGQNDDVDAVSTADELVAAAIDKGMRAAFIDAGTKDRAERAGLSDLAANTAEFADAVHELEGGNVLEVPWGTHSDLDARSTKPSLLAEALADLSHLVVIYAGNADEDAAHVAMFSEVNAQCVLVNNENGLSAQAQEISEELLDAGFAEVTHVQDGLHTRSRAAIVA